MAQTAGYLERESNGNLRFTPVSPGSGVDEFIDLTDTPASYVDKALFLLGVNAGETAIEFIDSLPSAIDALYLLVDGSRAIQDALVVQGDPHAQVVLNGAAGTRGIAALTEGSPRWVLALANGTAESGSEAGSDFNLVRFDDSGDFIDTVLAVERATGDVAIANDLDVGGQVAIDHATRALLVESGFVTPSNSDPIVEFFNNGILRSALPSTGQQNWSLFGGGAEAGSIGYTTPGGLPGIVFRNPSGEGRSQIAQFAGSGGIGMGATSGSGNPGNQLILSNTGNVSIGSSAPATSARLDIQGTNGALLLPRLTTTQRNALTAADGMIIMNTTTGKVQARAGGSWVDLHA